MLGTGGAFAKTYYNNNALLFSDGFTLLIDCGITAPRALHELNIRPDQLDGIFISHQHADHVGGLEEIAFRLLYAYGGKRIKLFVPEELKTPLWEHTLKGGMENPAEGLTELSNFFEVIPLQEGVAASIHGNLRIEPIKTVHIANKPSFSLIINDSLFYSSDIVFSPELLKWVCEERRCRYILHDCQLRGPGIVHAALEDLLTLPEHIQSRMYLMHYGNDMDDPESCLGKTGKMTFLRQHELYTFD
jgi:ribonuclease BN (tRNA processing enzyme)